MHFGINIATGNDENGMHLPYQFYTSNGGHTMEAKVLTEMKKAGKPVRPGDIAKALGVDNKEVSNAIKVLKKEGKVVSPKRCYYEPA